MSVVTLMQVFGKYLESGVVHLLLFPVLKLLCTRLHLLLDSTCRKNQCIEHIWLIHWASFARYFEQLDHGDAVGRGERPREGVPATAG